MKIFPAIDLYDGKAVRLFKGDYQQMTVYSDDPVSIAKDFEKKGAKYIHVVDLEGAKSGAPAHLHVIERIVKETNLFLETGGGIRNMQTVEAYLSRGASRVILGTSAVTDEAFLKAALEKYGDKIAVGADIADGKIAIKGWKEKSEYSAEDFLQKMQKFPAAKCRGVHQEKSIQISNHIQDVLNRRLGLRVHNLYNGIASDCHTSVAHTHHLIRCVKVRILIFGCNILIKVLYLGGCSVFYFGQLFCSQWRDLIHKSQALHLIKADLSVGGIYQDTVSGGDSLNHS